MNLCSPSVIRALMAGEGITFRHDYGQNFLIDPTVPAGIADNCADDPNSLILEIGPGIGCLTQELCMRFRKVVAVEIDKGLIPILSRTLAEYDNVTVVNQDVLKLDLPSFLKEHAEGEIGKEVKVSVCANLPYYITTPILMALLESGVRFSSITVMIQKEVANRLLAPAGHSDYGAITAVLGYYGTVRRVFTVPHSAFLPAPKVDSTVVRLDLYETPKYEVKDEAFLFRLIHGAFEQRRKTLVNALSAKCPGLTKDQIRDAILQIGHPETVRGERLSTEDFVNLSNILFPLWQALSA